MTPLGWIVLLVSAAAGVYVIHKLYRCIRYGSCEYFDCS